MQKPSNKKPDAPIGENSKSVQKEQAPPAMRALSAGEWLRAVTDFRAPFGHDGLPTVWG